MASWQWFGQLHRAVFRATGGRIGGRLAGRDMLLLTTTGRRSGALRTTPLAYLADGEDHVVVASNNGEAANPAWWWNLEADPHATIELRDATIEVTARRAEGAERERLWPLLTAYNPPYASYAKRTDRVIPVVVLRRRRSDREDAT